MKKKLFDLNIVYIILGVISFTSCEKDVESKRQFSISEENMSTIFFDATGGEKKINIDTNVDKNEWSANSNTDWCHVEQQSDGITVTAGSNELYVSRTARITIRYGSATFDISVSQKGLEPQLLIEGKRDGTTKTIEGEGGIVSITVTSNMIVDSVYIPPWIYWIHLETITEKTGDGTEYILTFKVDANVHSTIRNATLTLRSKQNVYYTSSFIIKQDPCRFELIPSESIWKSSEHSAFTGLIRYNNYFYVVFREAPKHTGAGGKIRLMRSSDGIDWVTYKLFEVNTTTPLETDLRDPKISITPENKIMVLVDVETYSGGSRISRRPYVSFSDNKGENFSELQKCTIYNTANQLQEGSFWIWRVSWNKQGTGYGFDYLQNWGSGLTLFKTTDGITYHEVTKISAPNTPNETTIRFDANDNMYALIRTEKNGILVTGSSPYTNLKQQELDFLIEGQDFIFLDDQTVCIGTRRYDAQSNKRFTSIYITDSNFHFLRGFDLESGSDTSYPGLVVHDDKLWISYYSTHEGVSSIYFTSIPTAKLLGL